MEGPDETDIPESLWRTFYARAVRELAEGKRIVGATGGANAGKLFAKRGI